MDTLPVRRRLNLIDAFLASQMGRAALDEQLKPPPDPETWGTGAEAEAGLAAAMALVGGVPSPS